MIPFGETLGTDFFRPSLTCRAVTQRAGFPLILVLLKPSWWGLQEFCCLFVFNFRNRVSCILSLTFICNLGWNFWPFSQVWGSEVCSTMSDFLRPSFVLGRPCAGWVSSRPQAFIFLPSDERKQSWSPVVLLGICESWVLREALPPPLHPFPALLP